MKTTIELPDSLMERCKQVAREQNVTFRALVEEGLDKVLAERARKKSFRLRTVPPGGGGFRPGFEESGWDKVREAAYDGHGG